MNTATATVIKMPFAVDDVVQYKNSASKPALAKVETFEYVGGGKIWFTGKDEKTGAKVWYPVHLAELVTNTTPSQQ